MKVSIYRLLRDPNNYDKIVGKATLRVVNVHKSFVGIGENEEINRAEFKKLADALEPGNDGFIVQ